MDVVRFAVVAAVCIACSTWVSADEPASTEVVIVTLGDSITKGVRPGVTDHQTFSSQLEHRLKEQGASVGIINRGIGGERTDQALARLDSIIELQPDIVTVMYGTNDSYVDSGESESRLSVEQYRDNLTELVRRLRAADITPILMTEPRYADNATVNGVGEHPNLRLKTFVEACRDVATQTRVPLVDHFAAWESARGNGVDLSSWTTDGCHPNPVGHRHMALLMAGPVAKTISLVAPATATQEAKPPAKPRTDVSYGPEAMQVLDFWQAEGDGRRPLLVYIHGGGWTGGDKKVGKGVIQPFLDKGISVASINYRLTGSVPLPAPVHDAARAIQFLRSKADDWNIDKERVALTGGSAGACTSMWLLLHDDLADPDAEDPVLRESTRVTAAAGQAGQTSIDPKVIEDWLGPQVLQHRMINMAVGESTIEGALKNYDKYRDLYVEFSPYNHLTADDPPLFMTYGGDMTLPSKNAGHGIHHPVYGVKMKEKADKLGTECHLLIPGVSTSEKYSNWPEFLIDKLLAP